MKHFSPLFAFLGFLLSCTPVANNEDNQSLSVTIGAERISAVSALLKGKANLNEESGSVILGFQYYAVSGFTNSSVSTVISNNADGDSNYSASILGLEPNTTYKYWSFVRQKGKDTYGDAKEFTTKSLEGLLETYDAYDIGATSATLKGKADLTDIEVAHYMSYGFIWGTSGMAQETELFGEEIVGNVYSASLNGLSHNTQYWYKAFVTLDDNTFYGEVKTFTTNVVNVTSVSLDKTEYTFNSIGELMSLDATVLPDDATDKSITWSSENEDVAIVDSNGSVTAIGNGTTIITVTTNDQGKIATCAISVAQLVSEITLPPLLILEEGEEQILTATIYPFNANDKSLTWTSSDNSIATVDNTGKVIAHSKGTVTIFATANDGSGISADSAIQVYRIETPDMVDLGLSVKWATFNIGASKAEEYGLLYAWGETGPKSEYYLSNYKWCNGEYNTFTKYNTLLSYGPIVDNKTTLEPEDDVAHVKLGGKWRMPTSDEWNELEKECSWTWITKNGVGGVLFTATNGNNIFLPAAGTSNAHGLQDVGCNGSYWSSSLEKGTPDSARGMGFNAMFCGKFNDRRYYGQSVRPVSE